MNCFNFKIKEILMRHMKSFEYSDIKLILSVLQNYPNSIVNIDNSTIYDYINTIELNQILLLWKL